MNKRLRIFLLNLLPKTQAHKLLYKLYFHKRLDINNPKTLNEKIHWLILNEYGEKEAKLTDKVLVKNEINKLNIKNLYIPKTYCVYKPGYKDLNLRDLPNKFVLKCNNNSGNVFICTDKKEFNFEEAYRILKKDMKRDFSKVMLEYHYKKIKPCILAEEYLMDKDYKRPIDYKFYCYDGIAKYVMVCCDRDTLNTRDFFDMKWNKLDFIKPERKSKKNIEKPANFEEMVEIASKLSDGHKFVRVDLYNINGKIYFSELTFTPAAGINENYTEYGDIMLGKDLKL